MVSWVLGSPASLLVRWDWKLFSSWVWLRSFFSARAGCSMCSKAAESLRPYFQWSRTVGYVQLLARVLNLLSWLGGAVEYAP